MEPEDKQDKIELVAGKLRFKMNDTLSRFNIKSIQIQSTSTPKNTIQLMMNLERLIQSFPIEQCLNLAAKNYLCYVCWLRMCQLFTVLTGVIFQC